MVAIQNTNISLLKTQYQHWMHATTRLAKLENMASSYAWKGVDRELRKAIIESLNASIENVAQAGKQIEMWFKTDVEYERIRRALLSFRQHYLNTETTVHFFTDALNSRTNDSVASMLGACDILCKRSMEAILPGLGKKVPYCFTYLDRGLGASILKSGLRLWDGSISKVAAIKITFHNLYRPTAAIHETGHQIAHLLNWTNELATKLKQQLDRYNPVVADAYANWASEIAADNFAFVHTGFAAVASLHNVIAGASETVFAYHEGDPHPISYLRILFNIECCRKFYGQGPWDELEENFKHDYPIDRYNYSSTQLIKACEKVLRQAADICLTMKYQSFGGKSLCEIINPDKVSPSSLEAFKNTSGALLQSHIYIYKECLKLLALTGYKITTVESNVGNEYKKQEEWMKKLGESSRLN